MHPAVRSVIRRLRQRLGLTQEEFAHEIAVTVSTVNRWENAHAAPSKLAWKVIRDLARRRGLTDHLQPASARGRRALTGAPGASLIRRLRR